MVQRRTRARLELVISVLTLFAIVHIWRYLWDNVEKWDEPIQVSPFGLAVGASNGAAFCWAHDLDVGNMRTNRRRRVLVRLVRMGWQRLLRRVVPDSASFQYNFVVGTLIGTIGYRFWYGLLHPLPDPND